MIEVDADLATLLEEQETSLDKIKTICKETLTIFNYCTNTQSSHFNKYSKVWKNQLEYLLEDLQTSYPTIVITGTKAHDVTNSIISPTTIIEDRNMLNNCIFFVRNKDHKKQKQLVIKNRETGDECLNIRCASFVDLNNNLSDFLNQHKTHHFDISIEFLCPLLKNVEVVLITQISDSSFKSLQPHLKRCLAFFHVFSLNLESESDKRKVEKDLLCINRLTTSVLHDQIDLPNKQINSNYWEMPIVLGFSHSKLIFLCEINPTDENMLREYLFGQIGLIHQSFANVIPNYEETDRKTYFLTEFRSENSLVPVLKTVIENSLKELRNQYASKLRQLLEVFNDTTGVWITDFSLTNADAASKDQEEKALKELDNLRKEIYKNFEVLVDKSIEELAKNIRDFFIQYARDIGDKLTEDEIPSADDVTEFDQLKKQIENFINKRKNETMKDEFLKWTSSNIVLQKINQEIIRFKKENMDLIKSKALKISSLGMLSSVHSLNHEIMSTTSINRLSNYFMNISVSGYFSKSEKFAMALTSPFWVPLLVLTAVFTGPIIVLKLASAENEKRNILSDYQAKPDSRLPLIKKLLEENLNEITKNDIKQNCLEEIKNHLRNEIRQFEFFMNRYCICPKDRDRVKDININKRKQMLNGFCEIQKLFDKQYTQAILIDLIDFKNGLMEESEVRETFGFDVNMESLNSIPSLIPIGNGNYGSVYGFTVSDREHNRALALKVINTKISDNNRSSLLCISHELQIFKTVRHKNIAEWLGNVYFPNLNCIGLITKRYTCNLRQYHKEDTNICTPKRFNFQTHRTEFKETLIFCIQKICLPLLEAIIYLHNLKILHRDIKMENVLVDCKDPHDKHDIEIRVIDFGCAKREDDMSGNTVTGSPNYMAPECNQGRYYRQTDTFALGKIFWELYYGYNLNNEQQNRNFNICSDTDFPAWDSLVQLMTAENYVDRAYPSTISFHLKTIILNGLQQDNPPL